MSERFFETANPHGMCGGVFAALKSIDRILDESSEPVYILHELVHNNFVTASLQKRGVRFADSPQEIPPGAITVIGAHGVSAAVESELKARTGRLCNTTCPLVKKLHDFAASIPSDGNLIIFGKESHPEVQGIAGHSGAGENFIVSSIEAIGDLPEKVPNSYYLSQTTVDAEIANAAQHALQLRYPGIICCPGVCDASRQRQQAIRLLAARSDLMLIVGSPHSSNACRLREISAACCPCALLVENADAIPEALLLNARRIGVSSGASTPEFLIDGVRSKLLKYAVEITS